MLETTSASTKSAVRREPKSAAPRKPARGPAPGSHAGELEIWARLERFLVLGTDGGAYVAGAREPADGDAQLVARCLAADGIRTTDRIVAAARTGRAPKNDPALFSLAMAAKLGDEQTRRAAYAALPQVCRIGTQLMRFAAFAERFGGWGRGMRKAVGAWFNERPADDLAVQLAKYPSNDGWSHRDLLRLAHPRAASPSHDRLYSWAVRGELPDGAVEDPALAMIVALDELRRTDEPSLAARLILAHGVPAECVPAGLLQHPEVWEALLAGMPVTALLRDLAAMTRVGLLAPASGATAQVVSQLRDRERIPNLRLHPLAILAALLAYRSGRGARGQGTWQPVASIVDALDAAFYASFGGVEPAGTRMLIALDVSGSMGTGSIAGVPGLTPRIASAAMALVAVATEPNHACVAFTAATGGFGGKWGGGTPDITTLAISPRQRLDDVVEVVGRLPMGGVDCALPMIWAHKHRVDVDTFVVYTDNETWAGDVPPAQALRAYRDARGIPAKLIVVGMTSNGFSIADPNDAGMLDVVGFDTSTPPVIADFARA
jgi:60 kDa SS-A/Ro ribonucleoprotein